MRRQKIEVIRYRRISFGDSSSTSFPRPIPEISENVAEEPAVDDLLTPEVSANPQNLGWVETLRTTSLEVLALYFAFKNRGATDKRSKLSDAAE